MSIRVSKLTETLEQQKPQERKGILQIRQKRSRTRLSVGIIYKLFYGGFFSKKVMTNIN